MRAKTLLLSAALGVACIITASAQQTVYSVNAVGYVNVTVAPGQFALLANPLNLPTNSLAAVLPDAPAGTLVYEWDPVAGFAIYTKRATGAWGGGGDAARLEPGEGFFVKNAGTAEMKITFVGEVVQGTNVINYPAGFSLLASKVPQAGKLETDLKFTAATNDRIYLFNNTTQAYDILTKRASGWGAAGEPTIGVAQGFFVNAVAPGTWTRAFNVNQ